METRLQISRPKHFGNKEVLVILIWGLLTGMVIGALTVAGPCLLLMGLVTSDIFFICLAMPVLAFAVLSMIFYPISFANFYVSWLVRKHVRAGEGSELLAVCQISFSTRLYGILRNFNEDADDVGCLLVLDDGIRFVGDHVELELPFAAIKRVELNNIGWRGLWLSRSRMKVLADTFEGCTSIEFCDRSSLSVIGMSSRSKAAYAMLGELARVKGGAQ
jgi:hypothetical protein